MPPLTGSVDELMHKPISELLENVSDEQLNAFCRGIAGQLLELMQQDGALNNISAMVHVSMEELIDNGQMHCAELGEKFFGKEQGAQLRQVFCRGDPGAVTLPQDPATGKYHAWFHGGCPD